MKAYFRQLDRLLRGEATTDSALQFGSVMIPLDKILIVSIVLAAFTGLCMGTFAVVNGNDDLVQRMLSTVFKVPILFFLTLFITFPSLYAFNAIIGSRLEAVSLLRLLVAGIGVMTAVLASLGPIIAFFSISATNYHFVLLLNVAVFAAAGLLGFRFLYRTLDRLNVNIEKDPDISDQQEENCSIDEEDSTEVSATSTSFRWLEETLHPTTPVPGPLDRTTEQRIAPKVKLMFRIWIFVFGLVGAQMGWVLRPFVGKPDTPFQWLSERDSNFFEAVLYSLGKLFF